MNRKPEKKRSELVICMAYLNYKIVIDKRRYVKKEPDRSIKNRQN